MLSPSRGGVTIPNISDYIFQSTGAGTNVQSVAGVWVQLVNNTTSTAYVSTAPTTSAGLFLVNNVPAGTYTVNTGPTNTGPFTATGDNNYFVGADVNSANSFTNSQTITAAPNAALVIGDTTARVLSGATSFSVRDNFNANDNFLLTNAGAGTIRNGLTLTAGGLTVTAGNVAASSSAVTTQSVQASGVGSFTNAGRLLGAMTVAGPPSSGTYNTGDYGFDSNNIPWLCVTGGTPGTWKPLGGRHLWNTQTLGSIAASITVTPPSTGFSHLEVVVEGRTTGAGTTFEACNLRMNGDSTAGHYVHQRVAGNGTGAQNAEGLNDNAMSDWFMPQNGVIANMFGVSVFLIPNFLDTTRIKKSRVTWDIFQGAAFPPATTTMFTAQTDHWWNNTVAITSLVFSPSTNSWLTGTKIDTYVVV